MILQEHGREWMLSAGIDGYWQEEVAHCQLV